MNTFGAIIYSHFYLIFPHCLSNAATGICMLSLIICYMEWDVMDGREGNGIWLFTKSSCSMFSMNWTKEKLKLWRNFVRLLHQIDKRQGIFGLEHLKWCPKEGEVIRNTNRICQEIGSGNEENEEQMMVFNFQTFATCP